MDKQQEAAQPVYQISREDVLSLQPTEATRLREKNALQAVRASPNNPRSKRSFQEVDSKDPQKRIVFKTVVSVLKKRNTRFGNR